MPHWLAAEEAVLHEMGRIEAVDLPRPRAEKKYTSACAAAGSSVQVWLPEQFEGSSAEGHDDASASLIGSHIPSAGESV